MEDRGRHRIGISQKQPHINADVVKYCVPVRNEQNTQ
jgi:hypothetical protein